MSEIWKKNVFIIIEDITSFECFLVAEATGVEKPTIDKLCSIFCCGSHCS